MNTPMNVNAARRQANIALRATDMFLAIRDGGKGYTAYRNNDGPVWSVISPNGAHYAVTLGKVATCSCPDFEAHQDFCKHTYGLQLQLQHEEEEEQCEQYDAVYGGAETAEGCDAGYCFDRF